MKQLAYSSTAAFLAHYRVLSNAEIAGGDSYPLSSQDHETLDAMGNLIEVFTPEERAILMAGAQGGEGRCASGEERRRRERAELKLRRLLVTKGVVRA